MRRPVVFWGVEDGAVVAGVVVRLVVFYTPVPVVGPILASDVFDDLKKWENFFKLNFTLHRT
jgi:hypothetical protein